MKKQSGFVIIEALLIVLVLLIATAAIINFSQAKKQSEAVNVSTKKQNVPTATRLPSASSSPNTPNTIAPSPSQTPVAKVTPSMTPPVNPSTPIPTSSTQPVQVTEYYTISSDGQSAQESPVTTTLNTTGNVKLIINLSCQAACKFKLASNAYPTTDNTVYTTSQKITYSLTQHGTWYFYNDFTPGTKFGIRF